MHRLLVPLLFAHAAAALEIPEKLRQYDLPEPARAAKSGARFVDLNGDGHEDIVLSNPREYGVFLFVPKERAKANLQWHEGWSQETGSGCNGLTKRVLALKTGHGTLYSHSIRRGLLPRHGTRQPSRGHFS